MNLSINQYSRTQSSAVESLMMSAHARKLFPTLGPDAVKIENWLFNIKHNRRVQHSAHIT